jgi:hypothetical protein
MLARAVKGNTGGGPFGLAGGVGRALGNTLPAARFLRRAGYQI